MFPHERSLVETHKNRPFVLLGVNTDTDRDEYKRQVIAQKINWRSAWTGGTNNEISRQFRVSGYPTVFLLDATGKIRKKWVGPPPTKQLDAAIEELLNEIKRD